MLDCNKQYNERTGSPLNFIAYPTDIVMMVVHYYYRIKVSLDNVVKLMAMRGFSLSHQTVHNWVQTFGVDLSLKLRKARKNQGSNKWHVDATYIKVEGHWCYPYRAIDKQGNFYWMFILVMKEVNKLLKIFSSKH